MPREAKIYYEPNWPWPGQPWPWCSKVGFTAYDGTEIPSIPHDTHMTNGGNTRCPGIPGLIEED